MNEETIDYRLNQIEKKLDQLTDLLIQTQAQEMRLSTLEKAIQELKAAKSKNTDRWLNPLIATIVSAIVGGLIALITTHVGV